MSPLDATLHMSLVGWGGAIMFMVPHLLDATSLLEYDLSRLDHKNMRFLGHFLSDQREVLSVMFNPIEIACT